MHTLQCSSVYYQSSTLRPALWSAVWLDHSGPEKMLTNFLLGFLPITTGTNKHANKDMHTKHPTAFHNCGLDFIQGTPLIPYGCSYWFWVPLVLLIQLSPDGFWFGLCCLKVTAAFKEKTEKQNKRVNIAKIDAVDLVTKRRGRTERENMRECGRSER